jgi:hypothetical protein
MFAANTDSVTSISIFWGSTLKFLTKAKSFFPKSGFYSWIVEILIDTVRSVLPVSLSFVRNLRAPSIIRSPIGIISFFLSSIGMNSLGDIMPSFLLLSLARASKPLILLLSTSRIG